MSYTAPSREFRAISVVTFELLSISSFGGDLMTNPLLPTGRIRRSHYIAAVIALNVASFAAMGLLSSNDNLVLLISAFFFWPMTMLTIQRVHDFGSSAALAIATILILVALIVLRVYLESDLIVNGGLLFAGFALNIIGVMLVLVIMFRRGTVGANDYGPDPRGREKPEALGFD